MSQFHAGTYAGDNDARVCYRRIYHDFVRVAGFVSRCANGAVRYLAWDREGDVFRLDAPRFCSVHGLFSFLVRYAGRQFRVERGAGVEVVRTGVSYDKVDVVH